MFISMPRNKFDLGFGHSKIQRQQFNDGQIGLPLLWNGPYPHFKTAIRQFLDGVAAGPGYDHYFYSHSPSVLATLPLVL